MAVDKGQILKWSLIAIGAIIFGIIMYAIFSKKTTTTTGGSTTNTSGGIGETVGNWWDNIFGGNKPKTTPTTGGSSVPGVGCPNINDVDSNGNPCPPDCFNGCKSSKPGYDCNGNFSANC